MKVEISVDESYEDENEKRTSKFMKVFCIAYLHLWDNVI